MSDETGETGDRGHTSDERNAQPEVAASVTKVGGAPVPDDWDADLFGEFKDGGTYDFACPHEQGCGDAAGPWRSTGWPTRALAEARGRQHLDEHAGKGIAPQLHEFRDDNNLTEDATFKDGDN